MGRRVEKRRQAITDLVNQLGTVSLQQLKERFPSVSEVTLRKDLLFLDEKQQIIRIHGGAKQMPMATNITFRSSINQKEKSIIAEKAAKLLQPNSTVFITAGTTCIELAKHMPNLPLCVFTDGLTTACNLPAGTDLTAEILGGSIDLNTMRVSGLSVLDRLESLRFNIAFLGTPGFHPDHGFSYFSEMTAATIKKVIERADKVVMLMDSSKVNYILAPWNIPLDAIDVIVSDDLLEEDVIERIRAKGVTVL